MQITIGLLEDHGACESQCQVFATEWPKGCTVTLADARRAAELGLDLEWASRNLLTAPAEKAYQDATATAEKAYQDATATAWKAYQDATAPAKKAYQDAKARAFALACKINDKTK